MNVDRILAKLEQQADAYSTDPAVRCAYMVGLLRGELRSLCSQVSGYTGAGQKPQRGCEFATVCLEDAETLVEFEFTRAEEPVMDADSPLCGPGHPASLTIIQALINGVWVDPRGVLDEGLIERWEQKLTEQQLEAA